MPRDKAVRAKKVTLAVDLIDPNDYNPNQMTEVEFDELVTEVKRLKRIAKPVVVRPKGERFSIVDGEHNWRAAKEAELKTIPCELTDVDDFEAMRQTFKRNQHGSHNPVRLGQMFQAMMQKESLSQRGLATRIDVSEGTIRNALLYAKAAALRNDYAFEDLTIKQIRAYLEIPPPINERWLDAGAEPKAYFKAMALVRVNGMNGKQNKIDPDDPSWLEEIIKTGLHVTIEDESEQRFIDSLVRAFDYWNWLNEGGYARKETQPYAVALAETKAPASLLELLPYAFDPEDHEKTYIPITPEEWGDVVQVAMDKGGDEKDQAGIVRASLRLKLHRAGVATVDLTDPRTIEAQHAVEDAPDFIRDADLPWLDKHTLATATCHNETISPDEFEAAKRKTVEILLVRNQLLNDPETPDSPEFKEMLGFTAIEKLNDVLTHLLIDRESAQKAEQTRLALSDRTTLHDELMAHLKQLYVVREGTMGDRPTHEVVAERLHALPFPEFQLIGALLTGHGDTALNYWLESVRQTFDPPENELNVSQQERLHACTETIAKGLGAT